VGVAARPTARRELLELLDIASSEHHIIRFQGGYQPRDYLSYEPPPLFLAVLLQAAFTDVVLVGPALIRKVS